MEAVARTVGFAREFGFVAEVTKEALGGFVTVREFGHTAGGALTRARLAAGARFTARTRRTGFYSGGFEYRAGTTPATFRFGFAA